MVHEVRRGHELIAALPMVRSGRAVRVWRSLENEHNPYFLVSGALDENAAGVLLDALLADADYVLLRRLPLESQVSIALRAAAARMRLSVSFVEVAGSGDARLRLAGPWDEFRASLPKNIQRDLPRKRRLLERQGVLTYARVVAHGSELDSALTECFELETRGWKGTHGSPINRVPETLAFYGSLAGRLARQGRFALYVLRLNERIIAFEYSLRGGGHIDMLKLSFDPVFAQQSPGQVLRMLLLEDEIGRGEVHSYHLGRPSEWKLRWASEVAPLCTFRAYASTLRGRGAYLTGPVLRARVKRVPGVLWARSRLISLWPALRMRRT
jgi:CelD/BcsL family acetyltransferase involved in cellulose biosynthesis